MKTFLCIILLTIITFSCQKEISPENIVATFPTLTTTPVTSITSATATSGGNITDNGGATVTARGVCWSTSPNPAVSGNHTTDGTGSGAFASNITGLTTTTTYYVRAYATNSAGTAYGNGISFTTTNTSTALPTVATSSISAVTTTTASGGGNVVADGGAAITARGVCWSTTANPTIALSTKTTNGTGIGTFTSSITGLTGATTYHVRAYATNSVGTAYGNDLSFTTTGASTPDVYVAGLGDNGGSNGVATVWKNGVATFLTNGTNAAEARQVFVSGTDVYVVGRETIGSVIETRVWKNGAIYNFGGCANAEAADIFISGTDIYVAGIENCSGSPNAKLTVWKNGVATALTNGTTHAVPNSIAVSGTDVYVSGEEDNKQIIWKNGVATILPSSSSSPYGWDNSVYASGADAYVAYNSNDPNNIPKIWKNGVVTNLANISGFSLVHDVYVSGSDVYAAGADPTGGGPISIAVMWKNGVRQALTNGTNFASAEAVFVLGTDVYVAGSESGISGGARLWKNGVPVSLSGGVYAYSVFVK